MPFQNYYVGSDLNNIGAQMQQDRDVGSRAEIARMEQQRLQYAALMQHLQQQQAQAQQAQQFQQELAFRSQGQGQENQYRNAMLGLKREEMNQFGPRDVADNTYRYAALQNAIEQAKIQATIPSQQAAAARINQQGQTDRAQKEADEYWQELDISSESKASDYNASVNEIKKQGNEIRKKRGWGPDDPDSRDAQAKIFESGKYSELINSLQSIDKRPGNVSPVIQPDGSYKFVAIYRRPQGQAQDSQFLSTDAGPRAPTAAQNPANPMADRPITVRTTDGKIRQGMASQWPALKAADPGAVQVSLGQPQTQTATNRARIVQALQQQPQGPQNTAMFPQIRNTITDYLSGRIAPVMTGARQAYGNLRDYIYDQPVQELFDSGHQRPYQEYPQQMAPWDYNPVP